jgi:hypothetical protein
MHHHSLRNPKPDLLSHIPGKAFWPHNSIQGGLASINVCLGRVAPVSALEDLPEQEETKVDWDLMMKLV